MARNERGSLPLGPLLPPLHQQHNAPPPSVAPVEYSRQEFQHHPHSQLPIVASTAADFAGTYIDKGDDQRDNMTRLLSGIRQNGGDLNTDVIAT